MNSATLLPMSSEPHGGVWPLELRPYQRDALTAIEAAILRGVRTRQGTACQRRDVHHGPSGRCQLHGGCSTGPKTAEGKRRSAANGLQPKRKQTP